MARCCRNSSHKNCPVFQQSTKRQRVYPERAISSGTIHSEWERFLSGESGGTESHCSKVINSLLRKSFNAGIGTSLISGLRSAMRRATWPRKKHACHLWQRISAGQGIYGRGDARIRSSVSRTISFDVTSGRIAVPPSSRAKDSQSRDSAVVRHTIWQWGATVRTV